LRKRERTMVLTEAEAKMRKNTIELNVPPIIPEGYCQCGCGQKTKLATKSDRRLGWVKGMPIRFINGHANKLRVMEKSPTWKGGKTIHTKGYVLVKAPNHPRAVCNGGYVFEHDLIAEKILGRHLRGSECVHHVDLNPGNNEPGNLVICPDNTYHKLLHVRTRAFSVCGNANFRRCNICKQYDTITNMSCGRNGRNFWHKACAAQYQRARTAKGKR